MKISTLLTVGFTFFSLLSVAEAANAVSCVRKSGEEMPVNNEQVIQWKKASANEFIRGRAHVKGKVTKVHRAQGPHDKHTRFDIQIGPAKEDTIQVFYNGYYAPKPKVAKGDSVEACGEFVADANGVPNIEDKNVTKGNAVLFWTHVWRMHPHSDGFLTAGGKTYGQTKKLASSR